MVRTYTEEIPDYGDLFDLAQFNEMRESGMITEDDGQGYWARDGKMSDDEVFSSSVDDATHVVWFNK